MEVLLFTVILELRFILKKQKTQGRRGYFLLRALFVYERAALEDEVV